MLHVSRRDRLALEPLLDHIAREITADPDQRDPARLAARRHDVAQAKKCFKRLRDVEAEKADSELRMKLNSKHAQRDCRQYTDLSGTRTEVPPHRSFIASQNPQLPLRAEPGPDRD